MSINIIAIINSTEEIPLAVSYIFCFIVIVIIQSSLLLSTTTGLLFREELKTLSHEA